MKQPVSSLPLHHAAHLLVPRAPPILFGGHITGLCHETGCQTNEPDPFCCSGELYAKVRRKRKYPNLLEQ